VEVKKKPNQREEVKPILSDPQWKQTTERHQNQQGPVIKAIAKENKIPGRKQKLEPRKQREGQGSIGRASKW